MQETAPLPSSSDAGAAVFAEARVGIVRRAARAACHARGRWRSFPRQGLRRFGSLEILHQYERAGAQAAANLKKVGLADLAHAAIELELLDRPQHQRLLALERFARPI